MREYVDVGLFLQNCQVMLDSGTLTIDQQRELHQAMQEARRKQSERHTGGHGSPNGHHKGRGRHRHEH